MRNTVCLISLILIASGSLAQQVIPAQQVLRGRVRKKGTNEVLVSVSIHNFSRHQYNLSDQGGNFRIGAQPGDTLIFSSAGYETDTLELSANMFNGEYQVYLEPRVVSLPAVRVGGLSNYQLDSIERRKDYDWVYGRSKDKLVNNKREGDGVGVDLNLNLRSSADRQRAELKKRLIKEEEEYYIDSRFSREYVSRLTHLSGDSLQTFMFKYRPPYKYCRAATNTDMLLWINDSYKKFMKRE